MDARLQHRFDALETDRLRLLRRLEPETHARLNAAPRPGAWSAVQVVHHVVRAEQGTVIYVRRKLEHPEGVEVAPWRSRLRLVALQAALRSPLRFQAPSFAAEVPSGGELDEARRLWECTRGEMRELLHHLPAEHLRASVFRHPFLGMMTVEHALVFLAAHLQRHSRQIERALRAAPPGG